MKPPINHMMLHQDTLADEFDAILGYRVMLYGVVLPASGGGGGPGEGVNNFVLESSSGADDDNLLLESGDVLLLES